MSIHVWHDVAGDYLFWRHFACCERQRERWGSTRPWSNACTSRRGRVGSPSRSSSWAMAESIALGARCLDDLAVTRAHAAQALLRGYEVPAPQTAGAWLRRFTLGHIGQLNKAMEIVQRDAIVASGATEVTLDFDSTYVFSRSTRRQGVDRTYKRGYALHPMLCFEACRAWRFTPGCGGASRDRRAGSAPSCERRCAGCRAG